MLVMKHSYCDITVFVPISLVVHFHEQKNPQTSSGTSTGWERGHRTHSFLKDSASTAARQHPWAVQGEKGGRTSLKEQLSWKEMSERSEVARRQVLLDRLSSEGPRMPLEEDPQLFSTGCIVESWQGEVEHSDKEPLPVLILIILWVVVRSVENLANTGVGTYPCYNNLLWTK